MSLFILDPPVVPFLTQLFGRGFPVDYRNSLQSFLSSISDFSHLLNLTSFVVNTTKCFFFLGHPLGKLVESWYKRKPKGQNTINWGIPQLRTFA